MDYLLYICLLYSVQISTASVNLALNKNTVQSSTYLNYGPHLAVDGNATADFIVPTCSHTSVTDEAPYWYVDLGQSMTLEGINITYRTSQAARMNGFLLIVSNSTAMVDGIFSGDICHVEARQNPPTVQYIDCFVVGRFVIYEDTTNGPFDEFPIIELCEVEVYGCPNGYYGQDCNSTCSVGCEGNICYPDNGTCVYGCSVGWTGDICNQGCMNGTWGADCSQVCYCDNGTCDPVTGMCPEDLCSPGWQGPYCNQPCIGVNFGPSCNTTCNCAGEVSCDPITGVCPEGCMFGFQPPTCHDVCDPNMFGPNCNTTCGYCYGSPCLPSIGICPDGCAPGWMDPFCMTPCPNLTYGMECSETCHCFENRTCDKGSGYCPNGECDRDWTGASCNETCTWNTFGYNCNETCHCVNNESCPFSYCNNGCEAGWETLFCNKECDMYRYGQDCLSTCGFCKENVTCDRVDGACPNGCAAGYRTQKCDTECATKKFGEGCSQRCNCKVGGCDHVTGECTNQGCVAGYMGSTCSEMCPTGQFGEDCAITCHCLSGGCNATDGVCDNPGCDPGWQGSSCSQECNATTYGANCMSQCGNCRNGETCHHVNGSCPGDCVDGYQQPMCTEVCVNGTYGTNCAQVCGACKNGLPCNTVSGVCPKSCEPGYTGLICKTDCNVGFYGQDCLEKCYCRNQTVCDKVSGACSNGECDFGWNGNACSDICPLGTFYYNCQRNCNCLTGFCNQTDPDGVCPAVGCQAGYQGVACDTVCSNGTYGPSCTYPCGSCYNGHACDHMSGVCPTGCSPGYTGLTCSSICDSWWYGQDCTEQCGHCYRDAICNPVTGACPNGLCSVGWTGTRCKDACPPTRYGEGCLSLCSEHCLNQECDRFDSSCTSGCITGYQGLTCADLIEPDTGGDYWRDQTKLVLYIIAGLMFLLAFLVVLCCLRSLYANRRKLKEQEKKVPRGIDIEEHAVKVGGTVPYQDITSDKVAETTVDDVTTDDQAALVDNQLDAVEEEAEPVVAPPTIIAVEKEETDANTDADAEDDDGEDYPEGDANTSDVGGTGSADGVSGFGSESATAALTPTAAATSAADGSSDLPVAMTYGFVLPEIVGTRILLSGFVTTVKNRKECGNLANEFKNLPEGAKFPAEEGKKPENKSRNRFRNILPYDHSRVVLDKGGNDYINASYIDGIDSERQYIATQGPKDDTVAEFWQMIWENNSGKVIMLANLIELGRPKCHQYWPNESNTTQFGGFVVKTVSEKENKSFTVRQIELQRAQDTTVTRTIHQLHFTTWPDHGTPAVEELVSFHNGSTNIQTPLQGPDVVHCSAGVGRTGTYIALDALTKHGRYAASLDAYEYTLKMRKDRMNMIQTVNQYICLHEALAANLPNATT